MPNEKVVAGMPIYNGEKFLVQRLENLLAIQYSNFEILISDNASQDSTQEICKKFSKKYKNIRYVRQNKNIGAEANFEFCLKNSNADYFFFAAHDDLHAPNYVEACVRSLKKNPGCTACYPKMRFMDEESRSMFLDPKDTAIHISSNDSVQQKVRYFMLGPMGWLMYSFLNLERLDPRLHQIRKIAEELKNEYPWVLALLLTGKLCEVKDTHFTYRLRPKEIQKHHAPMPIEQRKSGITDIHQFLETIAEFSSSPKEERRNRRALLLGALQSYGACKDWYQMTKHWLTSDLLRSYLSQQQWDLVFFFLLMKIFKIKPLRILLKQRIY